MLALAALGACGRPQPKGEVVAYVAVPLSGFQANGGQTVLGGVRLRAEQANAQGGLLGRRIKVVGLDDEADTEVALSVAQQVAAELNAGREVLGLIGHYNSSQTLAAMEIYKDLDLVVITPTASNVELTRRGYRNFFRVNATDAAQGRVDGEFLVQQLGVRKVAIVYVNDEYGQGLRDLLAQRLAELGADVGLSLPVESGLDSYADIVRQLKAAGPEAIFLATYETEGYVLIPEVRAAGIDVPIMCGDACFLSVLIDESGPAAEGVYVSGFTPSPRAVVDERWVRQYQAVEQRNPDTYSIVGYMAMDVLVQAALRARSFAAPKLIEAIHNLDYQGLAHRIAYDENGDLLEQKVYIFQVRGGQFEQVWP
jgi:branched-chain amino acid transport system substrate-binding protein